MPRPNATMYRRITNACTTMPRTRGEVQHLLQINAGRAEHYIESMLKRNELHKVGTKTLPTGHRAILYSVMTRPKPYTGPILTVWRGPLPPEWRTP